MLLVLEVELANPLTQVANQIVDRPLLLLLPAPKQYSDLGQQMHVNFGHRVLLHFELGCKLAFFWCFLFFILGLPFVGGLVDKGVFGMKGVLRSDVPERRVGMRSGRAGDIVGPVLEVGLLVEEPALVLTGVHLSQHLFD